MIVACVYFACGHEPERALLKRLQIVGDNSNNGEVTMAKNDVLTDADLAAGWILTCTGHPVTDDVVIEF